MNDTGIIRKKVSIIIPVHNTGRYLDACLSTITGQTFNDIEIICVDDCSAIETVEVLKEESLKDPRIRVIRLEKSCGAGNARNVGLKEASGDYVMFLDSDDFFSPELVEKLYDDITRYDADICVCGFSNYDDSKKICLSDFFPREVPGVTDDCFSLNMLDESGLTFSNMSPWNKMFRRSFLEDNDIHFQSLSSSNDLFFTVMCFLLAKRIVYCSDRSPLVNYRINTNGQISSNRQSINLYYAFEHVLSERGSNISKSELSQIVYAYMFLALSELNCCKDEAVNRKFYDMTGRFLTEYRDSVSLNDYVMNKRINWFLTLDYDTRWFNTAADFDGQIRDNFEGLSKQIPHDDKILIWGNGAKSKALQRVLKEKGYSDVCVTDIKNDQVGQKTESGYQIIHSDHVTDETMTIIASNHIIEISLQKRGLNCIGLEKYCEYE